MHISRREAQRLRTRVRQLEEEIDGQRRRWSQQYLSGVEIARDSWAESSPIPAIIRTARKLGHAVVCVGDDGQMIRFVALPHPKG